MADDPYSLLGVPRNASEDEIRRAFRKLAKELHPDVNAGKDTEERFKRVVSAQDFLLDGERRRRYDRGEIDANGDPIFAARTARPPPRPGGGMGGAGMGGGMGGGAGMRGFDDLGLSDVFDMFGGGGDRRPGGGRGQDIRYTLEVDFLEAVNGARKRVTLPDGGTLDLAVPEGVADGQVLRLRGKGGPGIEPGDAMVEIKVRGHHHYKRIGDDLTFDVPIAIDEAVLGAKIEVETPTGRVALTIPKGTSSGVVFRLKGKGVRNATSGVTGDCLVSTRIVLPPVVDDTLAYFLSEWRQKHRYDPGRG